MSARTYAYLEKCSVWAGKKGEEELKEFNPNKNSVAMVLDALKAGANLPASVPCPTWLDETDRPVERTIACRNGLLCLNDRVLLPHTPAFFCTGALDFDFDFDPVAPEPAQWLQFLGQLWPNDVEAIETLQELFGYCLTSDTTMQKIFLVVGPKRSGKGTIARVLAALLGQRNVAAPTLSALTTNFGLAPLIDKRSPSLLTLALADVPISRPWSSACYRSRARTTSPSTENTYPRGLVSSRCVS